MSIEISSDMEDFIHFKGIDQLEFIESLKINSKNCNFLENFNSLKDIVKMKSLKYLNFRFL